MANAVRMESSSLSPASLGLPDRGDVESGETGRHLQKAQQIPLLLREQPSQRTRYKSSPLLLAKRHGLINFL